MNAFFCWIGMHRFDHVTTSVDWWGELIDYLECRHCSCRRAIPSDPIPGDYD
jgi:hypothetical protein